MSRSRPLATLLLLVSFAFAGCGSASEQVADLGEQRALVDLDFTDASVPPEEHRSWSLLLDAEKVIARVSTYGELSYERGDDTPPEQWAALLDVLPGLVEEVDQVAGGSKEVDECAGGSALTLTVHEADADGEVARGQADEATSMRLSSCDPDQAAMIVRVQRAVGPLADLVGLPSRARAWPGR